MRPDLYRLFYPLSRPEQDRWAEIVRLPFPDYAARAAMEAVRHGCVQEESGETLAWVGAEGTLELMFFRLPDPGDLDKIREMYGHLEDTHCPIAYAFVNQRGDDPDAWDVFHLSRVSYLCHCNRLSGPGADSGS